ncbi:aminodeoxychorismate synthase component I [Tannerella forsythia]|uniref:Aminodeoxychorismate synthase component I n=1 Tax=Tannerella forsythia TaxID=28112 RepID=A0A3P1XSL6_TANFO|nr:aminodeoxychorismate synthase component I [Tannerella forsythia]RRD60917.1 aminodeoxychorismate synthase component I [Tannerella forsythia]
MKKAEEVIRMMNQAGAEGSPFVFGLDFELCRGFFILNPLEQQDVLFDFQGFSNCQPKTTDSSSYRFDKYPETQTEYARRFSIVREGLLRGDSFLTNLTVQTPIETNLSPEEIFHRSDALYKVYAPGTFVCFSPERFVKIEEGSISSNPMKGTIDARIPDAEKKILSDYKELSEHYTIVDLIRNDLSMVASQVRVERFRYIDRIETSNGPILEVSSEIKGDLPSDWKGRLGEIIRTLLPAGSISGAPKEATLRLIAKAEAALRGFYTGVSGYFDGRSLDSAVLIRFIDLESSPYVYRSGGGITVNSKMEDEYDEVVKKVYLPF